MARITRLPSIGVPNSSPRTVSMTGEKGWYSANQRIPAGIESGQTNALLVNASNWNIRARLFAPAGVLPTRPNATPIQVTPRISSDEAERREPGDRLPSRPEAYEQGNEGNQDDADHRSDQATDNLPDQHRGAGDRHGAEARNDALAYVHAEIERSRCAPATYSHDNNPRRDIVDVGTRATTYRAAKEVDKQQHHADWHRYTTDSNREAAQRMADIASQNGGRIVQGKGKRIHRTEPFCMLMRSVRAKKTPPRSGV